MNAIQAAERVVVEMMSGDLDAGRGYDLAVLNDLVRNEYPFQVPPFQRYAEAPDMFRLRTEMREWLAARREQEIAENKEFERREGM